MVRYICNPSVLTELAGRDRTPETKKTAVGTREQSQQGCSLSSTSVSWHVHVHAHTHVFKLNGKSSIVDLEVMPVVFSLLAN